ncbi:MAG: peptide deformylase [Candidatus Caldarchaeum sp.]
MEIVVPAVFRPLWVTSTESPVVKYPAEVLRQVAEPVERVTKSTREIIERMKRVMELCNGIGLAAPQVGVSQRVIVIAPDRQAIALVNPSILSASGEQVGDEGCLSLPALYGTVVRAKTVTVEGLDERGKTVRYILSGLSARVVQHEIDHLDGILFIDRADPSTLYWSSPAERDQKKGAAV